MWSTASRAGVTAVTLPWRAASVRVWPTTRRRFCSDKDGPSKPLRFNGYLDTAVATAASLGSQRFFLLLFVGKMPIRQVFTAVSSYIFLISFMRPGYDRIIAVNWNALIARVLPTDAPTRLLSAAHCVVGRVLQRPLAYLIRHLKWRRHL